MNPANSPTSASPGLFACHAKAPTTTRTANIPVVLMTTSSMDIGADVGRLSIVLRSRESTSRLPSTPALIRAKPRSDRTGLELRINFSLYMYGEPLSVHI